MQLRATRCLSLCLPLCLSLCCSHCACLCASHCASHRASHRASHCASHCACLYASHCCVESGGIIRLSEEKWEYDCFHDDTIKESLVQFACRDDHYSPAASLSFAKGDDVIKGLLHNPEKLDMTMLFIFFCIYFCLACWTYGIGGSNSSISLCLCLL